MTVSVRFTACAAQPPDSPRAWYRITAAGRCRRRRGCGASGAPALSPEGRCEDGVKLLSREESVIFNTLVFTCFLCVRKVAGSRRPVTLGPRLVQRFRGGW